jgi:hypothetical protein
VVVGQGKRLFPDTGLDIALDLIDSRSDSKGVTIQVYRPSGRPQYRPANVASNGSRAVDHDALLLAALSQRDPAAPGRHRRRHRLARTSRQPRTPTLTRPKAFETHDGALN